MEIVIGIIVAIVLLIFLTGKKRRANTISKEIYSLIRSGQNKNILHHIYFEAALKFALEHGGDSWSCFMRQVCGKNKMERFVVYAAFLSSPFRGSGPLWRWMPLYTSSGV